MFLNFKKKNLIQEHHGQLAHDGLEFKKKKLIQEPLLFNNRWS
jgi:hypothetical protein